MSAIAKYDENYLYQNLRQDGGMAKRLMSGCSVLHVAPMKRSWGDNPDVASPTLSPQFHPSVGRFFREVNQPMSLEFLPNSSAIKTTVYLTNEDILKSGHRAKL